MHVRVWGVLAALAVMIGSGGVSLAATAEDIKVVITPGVVATVSADRSWTSSVRGGGEFPPTVRLAAAGGEVVLLLSFMGDPPAVPTDRPVLDMVVEATAHLAISSVEDQCIPRAIAGHHGGGAYCAFTDARHVGQSALPPGEFRMISSGMIKLGNGYASFSILSNDFTSAEYRHALEMVSSVRVTVEED